MGHLPEKCRISQMQHWICERSGDIMYYHVGVMAFWMGIMEIASRAGIIEMASKKMRPLIRFLFPDIPKEHQANQYITTNFIANFLGLGWAATPAGLQGMQHWPN